MDRRPSNPKLIDTDLIDCIPQKGKCPLNCNQCYYNRDGAFFVNINEPHVPTPGEAWGRIVRMNSGHDSNLQKARVLFCARKYEDVFFNTSIPNFDFPGPVVYTANREEETMRTCNFPLLQDPHKRNLMFVRLRVSSTNLRLVSRIAMDWVLEDVPVVLTFMRYQDNPPHGDCVAYEEKIHITNKWWCPTIRFKLKAYKFISSACGSRLLSTCGTLTSDLCRDCRNCEHYYWIAKKRLAMDRCQSEPVKE